VTKEWQQAMIRFAALSLALLWTLQGQSRTTEYQVRLETTKGPIVIAVHRDWAPHGADRFYELVTSGYYDAAPFFRIRKGTWVQFGIAGKPKIAQAWRPKTIPDDPFKGIANKRGTVAFAFKDPNGRTTQVFINLRDNSETHDKEPFVVFGEVIEGMDVADALYAEYGEAAGGGIRAGRQDPVFEGGNVYLAEKFPLLDYIKVARVSRPAPRRDP
jgi:cyclophilin family peptidyl-prolyl cis-trans isomerase